MTYPNASFRLTGTLAERVQERGENLNATSKRDLERYYELLARELKTVSLSEREAMFLVAVTNGTLWQPFSMPLLWAEIDDAEDGYFTEWKIDKATLVPKLRALTTAQAFAVVDALERYWQRPQTDALAGEVLKDLGLIR